MIGNRDIRNPRILNPMKWLQVYLLMTVLLCFFGPIDWKIKNPGLVVIYLVAYQVSLVFGYNSGMRRVSEGKKITLAKEMNNKKIVNPGRLLIVGIIADVLMIFRMTNTFNPSEIFSKIVNGLISPSLQYATYYSERSAENMMGGDLFSFFVTLLSPIPIVAIVLGFYFYKDLSISRKIELWCLLIVHLGMKLISAANEGIFDIAIYVSVAVFLRYQNEIVSSNAKQRKKWSKKKRRIILLLIILTVLSLIFFTRNILGRTKGNYALGTLGENKYNPNSLFLKFIPDNLEVTIVYLSVYLCQGYYGFSLSTLVDWVPMFGAGFSSFIRNNIGSIIGIDLAKYTYQVRIENIAAWGALKNYHTAYSYWANDVSRIGVIFVMYIIGRLFARYYIKSVYQGSKIAIVIMPLIVTLIFYLPANNKIFAQPSSFLILFFILLYDFTHSFLKKVSTR